MGGHVFLQVSGRKGSGLNGYQSHIIPVGLATTSDLETQIKKIPSALTLVFL